MNLKAAVQNQAVDIAAWIEQELCYSATSFGQTGWVDPGHYRVPGRV